MYCPITVSSILDVNIPCTLATTCGADLKQFYTNGAQNALIPNLFLL